MTDKPNPDFTIDQLKQTLTESGNEGYTSDELAQKLGCGQGAIVRKLKKMRRQGAVVKVTMKEIERIDGVRVRVPAYQIIENKE